MKLAIMQPYLFPYLGYWQLIHEADKFILFDDAQYMRHGWVNRNRILKPRDGWQYIIIPLEKHGAKEKISNVMVQSGGNWKRQIIAQLQHYKKRARYFNETITFLNLIFSHLGEDSIANINASLIKQTCEYLNINKEILLSSRQNFDYTGVTDAGEWALRMSEQIGATEYINPVGGMGLFDKKKFNESNIGLSFLRTKEIAYSQRAEFEPALSIIDILMFNGKVNAQDFLTQYTIETSV